MSKIPEEIVERIIKCACPKEVCKKCGVPRSPIIKASETYQKVLDAGKNAKEVEKRGHIHSHITDTQNAAREVSGHEIQAEYQIVGWTDCGCNAGFKPGVVLRIA